MPVPDLDDWLRNWQRPILQRLGIRGDAVERGYARMRVDRPDDADELLFRSSLTIAADLAAISAVNAQRDEDVQLANGTAELHLSFVEPPGGVLPDAVDVSARVAHWADYAAHVELEAHAPGGELLARGLSTYSLRPVAGAS